MTAVAVREQLATTGEEGSFVAAQSRKPAAGRWVRFRGHRPLAEPEAYALLAGGVISL